MDSGFLYSSISSTNIKFLCMFFIKFTCLFCFCFCYCCGSFESCWRHQWSGHPCLVPDLEEEISVFTKYDLAVGSSHTVEPWHMDLIAWFYVYLNFPISEYYMINVGWIHRCRTADMENWLWDLNIYGFWCLQQFL